MINCLTTYIVLLLTHLVAFDLTTLVIITLLDVGLNFAQNYVNKKLKELGK